MSANNFTGDAGNVIQVGNAGTVNFVQGAGGPVRVVGAVTAVFQDRLEEKAQFSAWAGQREAGGRRLVAITGEMGVGKTTLARKLMDENAGLFPHAQLAIECGGVGEGHGRGLEEVCDAYLRQTRQPAGPAVTRDQKVALVSSLISGQPAVVLLDDVRSLAQIQSFLTCLPSVLVIITCRTLVKGLWRHEPLELNLDRLPDEAVRGLFERIVGAERLRAEPEAFDRLVGICAGLPLLATLAADLLRDSKRLRAAGLVRRIMNQGRLTALEAGHDETMVPPSAVLEAVYRELSPPAARLYRAIGLHPVRDFDPGLVTALFAQRPADGVEGLEQLERRGIVGFDQRGRYLMEDLTFEHARGAAERDEDPGEQRRIRRLIAGYYLRAAIAASRCLTSRWTLGPLYDEDSPFPLPDFAAPSEAGDGGAPGDEDSGDRIDPVEWTRESLPAIMACMERGARAWESAGPAPGYRWQMAEATNAYFTKGGPSDERATILAWGEEDADACDDHDAQARIQAQWGEMHLGLGQLDKAEERFRRSLREAENGTEYRGKGAALEWLGITQLRHDNFARALEFLYQSEPFLDPDRPRSMALLSMHRADALAGLGDRQAAMEGYRAALRLFGEHAAKDKRDYVNEGKVLMGQGGLLADTDRDQARAVFREALALFQTAGRGYQEAEAWQALGDAGDGPDALRTALALYEDLRFTDEANRVREKLGSQ